MNTTDTDLTTTVIEYYLAQATTTLTETQLTHLCFYTDYRATQHNNEPLTTLSYERAPYRITSPTISTILNNNPNITPTDDGYTYTGPNDIDSALPDFLDSILEELFDTPDWQSLRTFCVTTNFTTTPDSTITFDSSTIEPWTLTDVYRT